LRHGWAIPTATDIAFATGVLALLGRRVSPALRAFLLAIAVIDDVVAVLVIALAYTSHFNPMGWAVVVIATGALYVLLSMPFSFFLDRLLLGILAWIGLLLAGAHPAIAGAILGLLMPTEMLRPMEQRLHAWVAFGVMPLYAFVNAGVRLERIVLTAHTSASLLSGIAAGLVVGKPVGITLTTALFVRAGWCRLPPGVDLGRVLVVGCIAGMGFTMSIFICHLAFGDELVATAKLAVLIASMSAALLGYLSGLLLLSVEK
jgi:Na+:H+ antiporter, NhaA family